MKKVIVLFTATILLMFASCKSTEVAEEPVVPEEPAVEEVQQETQEEVPAEPEVAPVDEPTQEEFEKLEAARNSAIEAKAGDFYPTKFAEAENTYSEVKANSESKSAEVTELTKTYEALALAAQAVAMRNKIQENDLIGYFKSGWEKAETDFEKLKQLYESNASADDLLAASKDVNESYLKVLNAGLVGRAKKARAEANEAKKLAESVSAQIAEKETYKSYADKISKADTEFVTRNPEGAYEGYKEAATLFTALYESVSEKRAAAQARIDQARLAVEQSKTYATEADQKAPLEGMVEGIEDENSTLLEVETFASPEEAVIDVDSTEVGKAASEMEESESESVESTAQESTENSATTEETSETTTAEETTENSTTAEEIK